MSLQKRRRAGRRMVPAVPSIVAFSAAALIIFVVAAFRFFIASSTSSDLASPTRLHHHPRRRNPSLLLLKKPMRAWKKAAGTGDSFRVLSGGRPAAGDLWCSKFSKDYSGCSNASNAFAASEENNLPHKYLMIATSGGLNQQRTGTGVHMG